MSKQELLYILREAREMWQHQHDHFINPTRKLECMQKIQICDREIAKIEQEESNVGY